MYTTRILTATLFLLVVASCNQKEKDDEIARLKAELQSAQGELTQTKNQLAQTRNELTAMKAAAETAQLLRDATAGAKINQIGCQCSATQVQVTCNIRNNAKVAATMIVKGGASAQIGDEWPWLESQSSITLQPNLETNMQINSDLKSGSCTGVKNCKCEVVKVALR